MHVWGIATQEEAQTVREYAEGLGATYPILIDTTGSVHAQYQQQSPFPTGAYPQDWIVGTDGQIVYVNNTFSLEEMIAVLDAELAP